MEVRLHPASHERPLRTTLRRTRAVQGIAGARTIGRYTRWLRQAERVSERYGIGAGLWESAPLAHRRTPARHAQGETTPGAALLHLHQAWPLYLTLKLAVPTTLNVVRPHSPASGAPGTTLPTPHAGAPAIALASVGTSIQTVLTRLARQETWATLRVEQRIVERILARIPAQEREDIGSQPARSNPWESIPAPQRIVNHPQPAAPTSHESAQPPRPPAPQYWDGAHTPSPHKLTPDNIDVNGLTDRVLRALDERVVAERERFGRR
jgi:hypothetical protein